MRSAMKWIALVMVSSAALVARADRTPTSSMLVHLEISEGQGGARHVADHAIVLGVDGQWGSIDVNDAGSPAKTRVKLRVVDRTGGTPLLVFDVEHKDGDHASFAARGEVDLPAPGRRIVVARVPRAGGDSEVAIQIGK